MFQATNNALNSADLILAIFSGIISIIGILLIISGANLFGKRLNKRVYWGAVLTLFGIFGLSYTQPQFGNALVVLGTLVLAFAAFWSVKKTTEEQNRIRVEDRKVEVARRILDEILLWCADIRKQFTVLRNNLSEHPEDWNSKFQELKYQGAYILINAGFFEPQFQSGIKNLLESLNSFIVVLPSDWTDGAPDFAADDFRIAAKSLLDTANAVTESTYRIKMKMKL